MSGKQRNIRKRRAAEEEDAEGGVEEEVHRETLEDLKLLQKQRKRLGGVAAADLARSEGDGSGLGAAEHTDLMEAYVKAEAGRGLQDEEEHMRKYIEKEVAARLGRSLDEGETQLSKAELMERELYTVPEELQATLKKEVSIPGMMTAITEVEVSAEDKMRKIEETEAIKRRMLAMEGQGMGDEGGKGGKMRRGVVPFEFSTTKNKGFGRGAGSKGSSSTPADAAAAAKQKHRVHLAGHPRPGRGPG